MRIAPITIIALGTILLANSADTQASRHDWSVALELDALDADASGKLAAEAGTDFARVAFAYQGRILPTLEFVVVADAVTGGSGGVDLTEVYLNWRPVPRSPFAQTLRVGAFYPPLSLENSQADWSSPYSSTFSAINTWIGEEIRTTGAEWSVRRALGPRARQREIRLMGAAFYANDPAGALLAWRGWAMHQRQSRLGDAITLPVLPRIQPDAMFNRQALATEPFIETDHRPGYYYGLEWRPGRRSLVTALHYDNHADPLSLKDGHYGWTTRFDHVGIKLELPARLGLILQWIDGTTVMGPAMAPAAQGYRVVDNAYDSAFALLTRKQGQHRWSLRFDDFDVTDRDQIPLDDNGESGQAWTVAWRYEPDTHWSIGLDWIALDVTRPAFRYSGLPANQTDSRIRLAARYRLHADARSR